MKIVTHNAVTGETVERDATPEEEAQFAADAAEAEARRAAEEAERAAVEQARLSARAKLAALGLSDEEVAALLP